VVQREVSAKIVIGEEAIKSACLEDSGGGREVDVGHILLRGDSVETRNRLLDLRRELEGGADFSEMAQRHSQDPQASQNKGRLGFISRGQFFKSFEDAAFSLKVGELSQPVKTRFGFHLIRIYGERSKSQVDCDEITPAANRRLRDNIWNVQRAKKMKLFLSRLRKKAEIIIFDRNGKNSK
jgi:parvulin-like peptidyl-prolyl isomerase